VARHHRNFGDVSVLRRPACRSPTFSFRPPGSTPANFQILTANKVEIGDLEEAPFIPSFGDLEEALFIPSFGDLVIW